MPTETGIFSLLYEEAVFLSDLKDCSSDRSLSALRNERLSSISARILNLRDFNTLFSNFFKDEKQML